MDIYLYPAAKSKFDIILSRGLRKWHHGWPLKPYSEEKQEPVIASSLYASLVERYGTTMGLHVFQQMYAERKGPFQEGAKYDPEKPRVARKVERAGGIVPDPTARLRDLIAKKLRR